MIVRSEQRPEGVLREPLGLGVVRRGQQQPAGPEVVDGQDMVAGGVEVVAHAREDLPRLGVRLGVAVRFPYHGRDGDVEPDGIGEFREPTAEPILGPGDPGPLVEAVGKLEDECDVVVGGGRHHRRGRLAARHRLRQELRRPAEHAARLAGRYQADDPGGVQSDAEGLRPVPDRDPFAADETAGERLDRVPLDADRPLFARSFQSDVERCPAHDRLVDGAQPSRTFRDHHVSPALAVDHHDTDEVAVVQTEPGQRPDDLRSAGLQPIDDLGDSGGVPDVLVEQPRLVRAPGPGGPARHEPAEGGIVDRARFGEQPGDDVADGAEAGTVEDDLGELPLHSRGLAELPDLPVHRRQAGSQPGRQLYLDDRCRGQFGESHRQFLIGGREYSGNVFVVEVDDADYLVAQNHRNTQHRLYAPPAHGFSNRAGIHEGVRECDRAVGGEDFPREPVAGRAADQAFD